MGLPTRDQTCKRRFGSRVGLQLSQGPNGVHGYSTVSLGLLQVARCGAVGPVHTPVSRVVPKVGRQFLTPEGPPQTPRCHPVFQSPTPLPSEVLPRDPGVSGTLEIIRKL